MARELFYDILDKERKDILPILENFKSRFYLAGGTALALQLGHRDSIDFDFFTDKPLDTNKLFLEVSKLFDGFKIQKTQEEKDTLSIFLNDKIKISFFTYPYNIVDQLIDSGYFRLASTKEIGCMKLSAITGRAEMKDYVDLYFILQTAGLAELLKLAEKKFPGLDKNLILKSMAYFEDIEPEPILYKHHHETDFEEIKSFLSQKATEYLEQNL